MNEERLWDARETASYLQVSRQQVYLLAERGELPSFKIGFLRRFSPQAVREWLERHAEGEPAA